MSDLHDTVKDLRAEVERLREQLQDYFDDPAQIVTDLRQEVDLVAASRDRLAAENDRLRHDWQAQVGVLEEDLFAAEDQVKTLRSVVRALSRACEEALPLLPDGDAA